MNELYFDNVTDDFGTDETPSSGKGDEPLSHGLFILQVVSKFLASYLMMLLLLVGIVGNSISIVVFFRRRKQDRASATYLSVLALVDLVNLSLGINAWLVQYLSYVSNGVLDIRSKTKTDGACAVQMHVYYVGLTMSAWILIIFTMERCLVVWFPLKMSATLNSPTKRKILLTGLFVLANLARAIFGPYAGLSSRRGCSNNTARMPVVMQVLYDLLMIGLINVLPCLLIPILNVLVFMGIQKNRLKTSKSQQTLDLRCLRNLMIASTFQVLFLSPAAAIQIFFRVIQETRYDGMSKNAVAFLMELNLLSMSLVRVNYCVNPIIYTLSLDYYRQELKRILTVCCPRWALKMAESQQTSSRTRLTSVMPPPQ